MTEELITPEQLTPDLLKSVYESAHLKFEIDDDGDIVITEGVPVFAVARPGGVVNLLTMVPANPESSAAARLAYVNAINTSGASLRATVRGDGNFALDWEINVTGGVTAGHVVRATQAFLGSIFIVLSSEGAEEMIVWE